jgi:hypothetical protein
MIEKSRIQEARDKEERARARWELCVAAAELRKNAFKAAEAVLEGLGAEDTGRTKALADWKEALGALGFAQDALKSASDQLKTASEVLAECEGW